MKFFQTLASAFVILALLLSCKPVKSTSEKTVSDNADIITDSAVITDLKNSPEIPLESNRSEEIAVVDSNQKLDHSNFNKLLQLYVTENGVINYKGFIKDKTIFLEYLTTLSENPPKKNWTKEDKLAYWMNVYNAFTIKLIIDNYPTKSIKDIKDAWDMRFFEIGKKWYNLNDVEHKVLRKMGDARIHFGINCASFSCPPLLNRAFTTNNVDNELDFLAHRFINDISRNTITEDKFEVSKIFQWFGKDFKTEGTLIDYLNKYSDVKIKKTAKRSFKKYDWNLNE